MFSLRVLTPLPRLSGPDMAAYPLPDTFSDISADDSAIGTSFFGGGSSVVAIAIILACFFTFPRGRLGIRRG